MNKVNIYLISALTLLMVLSSCGEKRIVDEFTEYNPQVLIDNDGKLVYADVESYPVLGPISSEIPDFDFSADFSFITDTTKAPSGISFNRNRLTIDGETGVLTYDNSDNSLLQGEYLISVGVQMAKGLAKYEDVLKFIVNDVPISVEVDNANIDVGALQLGPIATVSYTDNSGSGLITSVTYELIDAPAYYEIDEMTGEISKNTSADEGTDFLTIKATTNLGLVTAANLLTVNIGPAPTIEYFQQDGSTPLSKVTLSPWTDYSTSIPTLNGMAAASWALMLPDTLLPFEGSFSIGMSGEVIIAADAGLPEGDHLIGVIATNGGGVSKDFPDLFTIGVEFRWDPMLLLDDQINSTDANVLPEVAFPGIWAGYDISGSSNKGGWMKVDAVGSGSFSGMRRWDPGTLDACLTRVIDVTGVKAMRVNFGEVVGYGAAFTNRYAREFHYGESVTNLAAATFDASEWYPILAEDGPWQGINWNGGAGPVNEYTNLDIDLSNISGNTLYLMWRLYSKDVPAGNQNGQYIIDYVTAEQAGIFPAEEQ